MIGICGREGSGKTTVANMITGGSVQVSRAIVAKPKEYILDVLFGFGYPNPDIDMKDVIWGLQFDEAWIKIRDLFETHINDPICLKPICLPLRADLSDMSGWVEMSMAGPLKKIAPLLFEIEYDVLLGATPENRALRETIKTQTFNKCGSLTGRELLEFLGTNVFRNHFDDKVWIKILQRNAAGRKIVIPDVRFTNEYQLLEDIGGQILLVYRHLEDLILTEEDRTKHPAKWTFLTFPRKNMIKLYNCGTLEDLHNILVRNVIIK